MKQLDPRLIAPGTDNQVLRTVAGRTQWVNDTTPSASGWSTYTPVLTVLSGTNPTLGTGSAQTGRYTQTGKTVTVQVHIKFGSSGASAGTGVYLVSLPIVGASAQVTDSLQLGVAQIYDSSAGTTFLGSAHFDAGSDASHVLINTTSGAVKNSSPMTWAANDNLWITGTYEAA